MSVHDDQTAEAVYRLTIRTDEERAWLCADVLGEDGRAAVNLRPDGDDWLVEAYCSALPEAAALQERLLRVQRLRVSPAGGVADADGREGALQPLLAFVPGQDWVAKSQRDLAPVRAGRFLIHGAHDRARIRGRAGAIEIDAGRAFGTAHHGTTRGCLLALDALAKRRRFANALDLGCGSGVLAIAAVRTGCRRALATDIDPVAVAVARANCRLNRAGRFVALRAARGLACRATAARAPFDLIMANILAAPLLGLAQPIRRVAAPGGVVVLSGLLDRQAREVCGRYRAAGFVLTARLSLEGWSTLILRRR